jgi:hypothetical protein
MTRGLTLLPIAALSGLPVLVHPTSGFAIVAAMAGSLCAVGAFARWRPVVTAGAALTLIQYTAALVGTPANLASAIGLGVVLVLLLDVSEFVGRFHGAALGPRVLRRQARHWIASGALGTLAAAGLAAVPALVRIGGPPALPPLLAVIGALVTALGVAGAVWRRRLTPGTGDPRSGADR